MPFLLIGGSLAPPPLIAAAAAGPLRPTLIVPSPENLPVGVATPSWWIRPPTRALLRTIKAEYPAAEQSRRAAVDPSTLQ